MIPDALAVDREEQLHEELEERLVQLEELRQHLEEQLARADGLEHERGELTRRLVELGAQAQELAAEREARLAARAAADEQRAAAEAALRERDEARAQADRRAGQLDGLRELAARAQQQADAAEARIVAAELRAEARAREEVGRRAREVQADHLTRVRAAEETVSQLQDELRRSTSELELTKERLGRAQHHERHARERLDELHGLTRQLQERDDEVRRLTDALERAERALTEARAAIDGLRPVAAQSRATLERSGALEVELVRERERIRQHEEAAARRTAEQQALEAEVRAQAETIERLTRAPDPAPDAPGPLEPPALAATPGTACAVVGRFGRAPALGVAWARAGVVATWDLGAGRPLRDDLEALLPPGTAPILGLPLEPGAGGQRVVGPAGRTLLGAADGLLGGELVSAQRVAPLGLAVIPAARPAGFAIGLVVDELTTAAALLVPGKVAVPFTAAFEHEDGLDLGQARPGTATARGDAVCVAERLAARAAAWVAETVRGLPSGERSLVSGEPAAARLDVHVHTGPLDEAPFAERFEQRLRAVWAAERDVPPLRLVRLVSGPLGALARGLLEHLGVSGSSPGAGSLADGPRADSSRHTRTGGRP